MTGGIMFLMVLTTVAAWVWLSEVGGGTTDRTMRRVMGWLAVLGAAGVVVLTAVEVWG